MPIRLGTLLERVPPQVERQVKKAVANLRRSLADTLRAECGLAMQAGSTHVQVRVLVEPGYPVVLGEVEFPDDYEVRVALAQNRRQLEQVVNGAEGILELPPAALEWGTAAGDPDVQQCLEGSAGWARTVLRSLEEEDPLRWVLEFDEDILGVYRYDVQPDNDDDKLPNRASISLYWMVIGLVSEMLGCAVKDLTAVVLVHELAHAHTQLGADTGGRRWLAREFKRADSGLKEGLAQYYTDRVLRRLKTQHAGALAAYEALTPRQPRIYREHLEWSPLFSPEAVRRSLIEVRRWQEHSMGEFRKRLEQAQSELPSYAVGPNEPAE